MKKAIGAKLTALAFGMALSGAVFAQEVVKIGYSGPLSGGAALYGKNVLTGMEMAANEINAKGLEVGGKKYKVEIVPLDDKYNPSETAINVQRLIQQHKTPAVLVPHSGGVFAVQAFNEKSPVLLLAYTSLKEITARGNKMTVRVPPEISVYVDPFVRASMRKFGKKLAIASADHDYAKTWAAGFKPAWEAAGGAVVAENPMSYNKATDFYSGVSRVLQANPDVLFVGGASEPTALVIKQARELGFKGGFVVIDQAKFDEIGKVLGGYSLVDGSIGILPLVDDQRPAAKAFVERFRKANPGRDPGSEISLNYSAVYATVAAMKLAGTVTDPVAIRAQMDKAYKSLPAENNPHEVESIAEAGGSQMNTYVAVVEGGKVVPMNIRLGATGK
ncbi:ethanolamine utilization protein EutJ [Herbaspirillum sp. HC18]|nr:ethanolamine utilization protein EutJ [Herbaspirillum sp. HC18]